MDEYRPPISHDTLVQAIYTTDPRDASKRAAVWHDVETDMQHFDAYCGRAYTMLQTKLYSTMKRFVEQPPDLNTIENEADAVAEAAVQLNETIGQMFDFYVKLRNQFDLAAGNQSKISQFANQLIKDQKWCSIGLGDIVCMLSDIYYSLNELTESEDKPRQDKWAGVSTQKFFIRPEDITRVKIAISKHLPLLRFGRKQGVTLAQDKPGRRYSSFEHINNSYDNNGEGDETKITTVYLDTPKLYSYHEKILEKDGPTVLRARWYGDESEGTCFMERLSWRDAYATNMTKDRFEVPFDGMGDFIAGKYQARTLVEQLRKKVAIRNPSEFVELIEGIQKRIARNKLRPLWRVAFGRSTFQYEADNSVKLVLDASLQFIKEPSNPGKGRWCRDMSKPPGPEDHFYLPFGILEVKYNGISQPPKWLETLLKSDYVIPAHNFSKFFHGTARLYPLRCRVLPPWFAFPSVSQPGFPLKHWYRAATLGGGQQALLIPASKKQKKGKSGGISGGEESDSGSDVSLVEEDLPVTTSPQSAPPPPSPVSVPIPNVVPIPTASQVKATPPPIPPPGQGSSSEQPSLMDDNRQQKRGPFSSMLNLIKKQKAREPKDKAITPTIAAIFVEPKTYFANERTLLQWISISVLLATGAIASFALTSVASEASKAVGVALLAFALLFAIYALGVYHYRRNAIVSRTVDGQYDDKWGPTVLVIGLFIYLFASLILQLATPAPAPVGVQPFVRDYRVPLSSQFLSGNISDNLVSLAGSLATTVTWVQFRGSLNSVTGTSTITVFDSRGTCDLSSNDYYLTSVTTGGTTTFSFKYEGEDMEYLAKMDKNFPTANYIRQEIVHPPSNFKYSREKFYTGINLPSTNFMVDQLGNIKKDFYLSDVNRLNRIDYLIPVNNLTLTQETRGTMNIQLAGVGRIATFSVYLWYLNGTPVYGELSMAYPVQTTISRSEIRQLKQIYAALLDGTAFPTQFNTGTTNATSIYSYLYNSPTSFCSP